MENKTIIYLDQNFISDIAKLNLADKKDKVNPNLRVVFDTIKKGVDDEKFLSPDSWIHSIETAAENDSELRAAITSYQAYLGQISLNPPWEIKDAQFIKALLDFFEIEFDEQEKWRVAFKENPNKRMRNFRITVSMPNLGLGSLSTEVLADLQKIRLSGVKANDQYQEEIAATRSNYKQLIRSDFNYILVKNNISIEQAEKFVDSQEFTQIPNIDIYCRLWSKNLADKERKRGIEGDYNDIEFLSIYLPYCDVIATDHYMKSMVTSIGLDKKYSCQIFSMKGDGLKDMISYLEIERARKNPTRTSLFSVLCFIEDKKPFYDISFLKKINLARNKFQNTGKYWDKEIDIPVFLLHEHKIHIEMPAEKDVMERGAQALNTKQWSEIFEFGNDFKRVYNLQGKKIEEIISDIPVHLRGSATAILSDDSNFDDDVQEHDSFLFYDIENAIQERKDQSERYKIPIIYN